ncbi:MAG: AarF/UbiB family protein [Patescibacteria group bacterium]
MPFESPHLSDQEEVDILDYEGTLLYPLLQRLPIELAKKHIQTIERKGLSLNNATLYLEKVLQERKEAMTETFISDEQVRELFAEQEAALFKQIETEVFENPESHIGAGMTARVKRFEVTRNEETLAMAIKYLVSPTEKTLSAAAEHDMLREVERIKKIEEIEEENHLAYIRVPHPYFHHKTSKIQCYGMELVNGVTLDTDIAATSAVTDLDNLTQHLCEIPLEHIEAEIESFITKMHEYCLHGDIKPKNIMVNDQGKFYLIDFGQSILISDVSEKELPQVEELKDEEVRVTKSIIRNFIRQATRKIASA